MKFEGNLHSGIDDAVNITRIIQKVRMNPIWFKNVH